jgi:Flp pilus assembly protein TadG
MRKPSVNLTTELEKGSGRPAFGTSQASRCRIPMLLPSSASGNRSRRAGCRGQVLVEFAVSAVVLLTLMLGVLWFGRALYTYHAVSYGARAGVRYAIVHGSGSRSPVSSSTAGCYQDATHNYSSSCPIISYVESLAPGLPQLQVIPTWPDAAGCGTGSATDSNNPGCRIQVTVQYPFVFHVPLLPSGPYTLISTSEMVIAD